MTSYLYVMQAESGPVKIGLAKQPEERVQFVSQWHRWDIQGDISLRHQVPIPDDLTPRKVEHVAHVLAADRRLEGEWFDIPPDEALTVIHEAIALRGVSPKPPDVRINLSYSEELKEWISEFRFANKIPTEAEAMRVLFERALEASGTPRPSKAKGGKK